MNTTTTTSSGAATGRRLPFHWLFTWRALRRVLIGLAWVATVVALFYGEEYWRGRQAWNNCRRELEARGEVLDFMAFIPKRVPDDQNFAMTPLLAPLFDFEPGSQRPRDTNALARLQGLFPRYQAAARLLPELDSLANWFKGRRTDLAACQRAYAATNSYQYIEPTPAAADTNRSAAAAAVLANLRECDPVLDELRAAARRPCSRFNVSYELQDPFAVVLPHLAFLKGKAKVLQLRAAAELALGQTNPAFEDVNLMFQLADATKDEPILISWLVRRAEVHLLLQPIWEGLADGRWSEGQLQAFQQRLGQMDMLAESRRALQADRVFGNRIIEFVRRSPGEGFEMLGATEGADWREMALTPLVLRLAPRGWVYQEQVQYNRLFQDYVLPPLDLAARQVRPEVATANQEALERLLSGGWLFLHHRTLARALLPALNNLHPAAARAQTDVDLATVACALERYRLAKGAYPDSLDALAPGFAPKLPRDVINGQPLKYRRLEDGRFTLYSLGWDAKDDGGSYPPPSTRQTPHPRGPQTPELQAGDWVWRYPAHTPALQ